MAWTTDIYCFIILEAESPGSKFKSVWLLVRALFLVCGQLLCACRQLAFIQSVHCGEQVAKLSDVSSYKNTNPIDLKRIQFSSVQSLSQVWFFATPRTAGFPVHHQLPEFTQTHVHWVGDTIQPSHPLWSPSPPTFNLSQNQGLFKWVSSSHQVAKVLATYFSK